MAQRRGPEPNNSCLRKFVQSVELRTVPADFNPPSLGSAFILASLDNINKDKLEATQDKVDRLRTNISVCKKALRAALNPSAKSATSNWRRKSDDEILELMRKRKVSRHALDKRVGDVTRATYLYKMMTLPTDNIPRTKPRYKFVKDNSKSDNTYDGDPYRDFQTTQRLNSGNYMPRSYSSSPGATNQSPEQKPQIDPGPINEVSDGSYRPRSGKDQVSAKHLLPHLERIKKQRVYPHLSLGMVDNDKRRTPRRPNTDRRWVPETKTNNRQSKSRRLRRLPVRYKGFSGAKVLHSSVKEPWKTRDTPSQLRVSYKFSHRQAKANQKQQKISSQRSDSGAEDQMSSAV